jgi:hypothetical protein
MLIDESFLHPRNTRGSIDDSLDPLSNVTAQSERHREKHSDAIQWTDDGMQIDDSQTQPVKAPHASDESRVADPNGNSRRDSQ